MQMSRGVEALTEARRLNGGGPWLQQQQQQQQRGAVMSNGSARMLLHVPAPAAHDRLHGTGDRPSSRGKSALSCPQQRSLTSASERLNAVRLDLRAQLIIGSVSRRAANGASYVEDLYGSRDDDVQLNKCSFCSAVR